MSTWNFIVVLCFALLYMVMILVHIQIRRLRDEMQVQSTPSRFPDEELNEEDTSHPAAQEGVSREEIDALRKETLAMRKEIRLLGDRLLSELEADERRRSTELDILHQRLQGLDIRLDKIVGADVSRYSHSKGQAPADDGDPHQKAKLLLSNGVPEERVIDETGLSVEEVSLLRSLMDRHNS